MVQNGGQAALCIAASKTQTSLLEWIFDKIAGPVLTGVVLAVIGSFILARLNERYRSRRDLYARSVDIVKSQTEALLSASSEYWCSKQTSGKSEILEGRIHFLFEDIQAATRACTGSFWSSENDQGPKLLADLMIAVSGHPSFASKKRPADPKRVEMIAASAASLNAFVLDSRAQYFQKNKPFIDIKNYKKKISSLSRCLINI